MTLSERIQDFVINLLQKPNLLKLCEKTFSASFHFVDICNFQSRAKFVIFVWTNSEILFSLHTYTQVS